MPVTSPHAIYGTGGGYPECTFSMVWPSERTQYTDAENIKGKKKTIKSLFCGRGFGCYHTAIVLQRARPSCGSDNHVKIAISSPAGDLKTVSQFVTLSVLDNSPLQKYERNWDELVFGKVSGIVTDRQSSIGQFFSCPQ